MLKVGITGGIGSGKTTVCKVFEVLGIPVFYADQAARHLMENDDDLINRITALMGIEAYRDGKLNRSGIAAAVFGKPELLQKLNEITHPAVIAYGKKWMEQQQSPYTLKEAALFFESGSHSDMDIMIGVSAPQNIRISRTMLRDQISEGEVLKRMDNQMDEDEKMKRCDFLIFNDERQAVIPQVWALHRQLLRRSEG